MRNQAVDIASRRCENTESLESNRSLVVRVLLGHHHEERPSNYFDVDPILASMVFSILGCFKDLIQVKPPKAPTTSWSKLDMFLGDSLWG